APAAGGVLVQVAAQRSEEAASSSYRDLQRRFPSILGAFQPQIVRVDLGEKGVYYRVRVGPFAGNDATRLCNDLKAAGGDCLLAR
ncbi:MAG: SPOR domain-containing protein, partial [Rhizobiales bacterium]|nr:SPOR domain-containing protein [Hyphomicrobiales bacterium]